jgi:hypothetical protein
VVLSHGSDLLGAHPSDDFVKFKPDGEPLFPDLRVRASPIETALKSLRRREFEAGRYNPVIAFPEFPIRPILLPLERDRPRRPTPCFALR